MTRNRISISISLQCIITQSTSAISQYIGEEINMYSKLNRNTSTNSKQKYTKVWPSNDVTLNE